MTTLASGEASPATSSAPRDALELVKALGDSEDIAAALKAYEEPRVAFGKFIVGHARSLGAYMQAQIRTPHERSMAERYRTPEAVMKETAVSPRMH